MFWLTKLVDDICAAYPSGEILIESGHSPSGTYHLGHLREALTCDAILLELKKRNRQVKHISFVDDLDALRKIPANIPASYEQYLGRSLCDIPAPEGERSYGDYFLKGFKNACLALGIEVEFIYSHQKYREGFFVNAIETVLDNLDKVKESLVQIGGRALDEQWSPIQINEGGYLKKRRFLGIDKASKTIAYEDKDGAKQSISYASGDVKLDWRIDWPARWHELGVNVEPFGRDHATKGGSYDTGAAICRNVFLSEPPMPVPYDFVNMAGDTKKMSASRGTGIDAESVVKILPPEIVRFFMLRYPPSKRLYFDPVNGVAQLIDEFAQLMVAEPDSELVYLSRRGIDPVVSRVPFSHLIASYQAALKDIDKTIDIIKRTEHGYEVEQNEQILADELKYIDMWLDNWAPEDMKFSLADSVDVDKFSEDEKDYLRQLADDIAQAPAAADGEWFHKAIYKFKGDGLSSSQLFNPLYRALIAKEQGPRAGWFLSILPRDWLIERLKLEA